MTSSKVNMIFTLFVTAAMTAAASKRAQSRMPQRVEPNPVTLMKMMQHEQQQQRQQQQEPKQQQQQRQQALPSTGPLTSVRAPFASVLQVLFVGRCALADAPLSSRTSSRFPTRSKTSSAHTLLVAAWFALWLLSSMTAVEAFQMTTMSMSHADESS